MSIQTGDKIPACDSLKIMGEEGPQGVTVDELFAGKKVVMFAVPGAFTPGCSLTHLPGYVVQADAIFAKAVDSIICMAVNDAFVMDAWGKDQNAEQLLMLADGNGDFSRAMGLTMDGTGFGMGERSKRFAMVVEDGTVTHLAVEPKGGITISSAESILEHV